MTAPLPIVDIRNALENGLKTMSPALATAWENDGYAPIPNVPYQRVTMMDFITENPTMGGTYYRVHSYFQIDLNYPIGQGTLAIATQAEAIKTKFKRSAVFSSNGVNVIMERTPVVSVGRVYADRFVVTIKIRYYADIFS